MLTRLAEDSQEAGQRQARIREEERREVEMYCQKACDVRLTATANGINVLERALKEQASCLEELCNGLGEERVRGSFAPFSSVDAECQTSESEIESLLMAGTHSTSVPSTQQVLVEEDDARVCDRDTLPDNQGNDSTDGQSESFDDRLVMLGQLASDSVAQDRNRSASVQLQPARKERGAERRCSALRAASEPRSAKTSIGSATVSPQMLTVSRTHQVVPAVACRSTASHQWSGGEMRTVADPSLQSPPPVWRRTSTGSTSNAAALAASLANSAMAVFRGRDDPPQLPAGAVRSVPSSPRATSPAVRILQPEGMRFLSDGIETVRPSARWAAWFPDQRSSTWALGHSDTPQSFQMVSQMGSGEGSRSWPKSMQRRQSPHQPDPQPPLPQQAQQQSSPFEPRAQLGAPRQTPSYLLGPATPERGLVFGAGSLQGDLVELPHVAHVPEQVIVPPSPILSTRQPRPTSDVPPSPVAMRRGTHANMQLQEQGSLVARRIPSNGVSLPPGVEFSPRKPRPSVGVPHVATHAVGTVGTAVTTSVGTVSSAVAASTVGTVATGFAATASAMPRCTSPWPKLPARERSLPSSVPATTQRTVSRQST